MRITIYTLLVIVICTMSISCNSNKSGDPLQPDVDREPQTFLANPEMLFGEDYSATFPEDVYCEVDITGVIQASALDSLSGQPVNSGTPDYWGSAVVTLMRDETDPHDPFKPVARWMSDDGTADLSEPFYVTGWEDTSPTNDIAYKHPKCASIAYSYDSVDYVELAVVYQMEGLSDTDIDSLIGTDTGEWENESNDGEWGIGLTILRWEADDIPDPADATRIDYFFPEHVNTTAAQMDDCDPELAYDSYTGDLFIVFSDINTPQNIFTAIPKYLYLERQNDWTDDFDIAGLGTNSWANSYPRDIRVLGDDHGGWDPSVAIGKVDLFLAGTRVTPGNPFIVISYTSQFDDQTGYHVNLSTWQLGYWSNRTDSQIRHPDFTTLNAGLSTVAITPNSSDRHYGALVFTQVTGEDQYGPTLTNYYVDLFNIGNLGDSDSFLELTTVNYADNLYPSITLHETDDITSPADYTSDVIWMAQDAELDTLHPTTALLTTTVTWTTGIGGTLSSEGDLDNISTLYDTNDYTIHGNYNPAQIPFIDPGMSTSIRSTSNNNYWGGWCNRIDMEPPAEYVWGTFGHST